MNAVEAMQALLDGKKIRNKTWDDEEYIYLDTSTMLFKWGNGLSASFLISDFFSIDWELYEEPEDTKLYQWVSRYGDERFFYHTLIATEKQAKEYFADKNRFGDKKIEYKKLDDLLGGQG